jgi:hypothetical protein
MEPRTLAIPIAFILLAATLCLLLIGSKWKWWQKLALIVIVPSFGLAVWASLSSYKGWPTTERPPTKSLVYWTLIREPDPKHGDPGAIYVWVKPLDGAKAAPNPLGYVPPDGEPRAYRLPYSRELHFGLQSAQRAIQEGRPIVLDLSDATQGPQGGNAPPGDPTGDGPEGGLDGEPRPNHGQGQSHAPPGDEGFHGARLYELPPPHPPEKEP